MTFLYKEGILIMNQLSQSIQYAFRNEEKYGKNGKNRIYGKVSKDASAKSLLEVGHALADLQGDELEKAILITKSEVKSAE